MSVSTIPCLFASCRLRRAIKKLKHERTSNATFTWDHLNSYGFDAFYYLRPPPQSCSGSEWHQSGHKHRWSCPDWLRGYASWYEKTKLTRKFRWQDTYVWRPRKIEVKNDTNARLEAIRMHSFHYYELQKELKTGIQNFRTTSIAWTVFCSLKQWLQYMLDSQPWNLGSEF